MPAKWTFMVYMAGDNNLSDAGDSDLAEMRKVGSTSDVNVVVEFDNAGRRGTKRYLIQRGGVNERVESLGETDSGDPQVLTDFIAWAGRNYPADRYALVLWNHGGGWAPSEMDRIARSTAAAGYSEREATERSSTPLGRAFFRTTLQTIFELPSSTERAICSDDGSGHSLDTIELGKVLDQATTTLGKKIELLGMDACLMSNLEVAYQARPYVNYIVASEESEPNEGWPYEAVLGGLTAAADLPTPEFATHVVNAYIQSYIAMGYPGAITQSAFDLAALDAVLAPLDRLASGLTSRLGKSRSRIATRDLLWSAQRQAPKFWHNTLRDLYAFSDPLRSVAPTKTLKKAALDLWTALQPGAGRFVIAEAHRGAAVARCGGVSIYLPIPGNDISRYYGDLAFARDRGWEALLQAYHAA
jgi:hypothetical protein